MPLKKIKPPEERLHSLKDTKVSPIKGGGLSGGNIAPQPPQHQLMHRLLESDRRKDFADLLSQEGVSL